MIRSKENTTYDILAAGELVMDLIAQSPSSKLSDCLDYRVFMGGSPSNLAGNMAQLGKKSALVASIGQDSWGSFLLKNLREKGVKTNFIQKNEVQPTSIIMVSKSETTPDFSAYRKADSEIYWESFPKDILSKINIFHTTCFGLSLEPARSSILKAARLAHQAGAQLSIDLNYAPQIWADRQEAQSLVQEFTQLGPFIKISLDDYARLYQKEALNPEEITEHLHQLGAKLVCLTMGKQGSLISNVNRLSPLYVPAPKLDRVEEVTGAGDAYWAGFLSTWLDGFSIQTCAENATRLVRLKLSGKSFTKTDLKPRVSD